MTEVTGRCGRGAGAAVAVGSGGGQLGVLTANHANGANGVLTRGKPVPSAVAVGSGSRQSAGAAFVASCEVCGKPIFEGEPYETDEDAHLCGACCGAEAAPGCG